MTGRSRLALRGEIFGDVVLGSAQPLREGVGHHGVEIFVVSPPSATSEWGARSVDRALMS